MLSIIANLYTAIKFIAISSFSLSCFLGKWIVYGGFHLQVLVTKLVINTIAVLIIAVEDFHVFASDLWSNLSAVVLALVSFITSVGDTAFIAYCKIKYALITVFTTITAAISGLTNAVANAYSVLGQLCVSIKHYVLLFGSGIWFVITLVPIGLVYLSTLFVYYIGRLFEEALLAANDTRASLRLFCLDAYEFVTDVPLESLLGLIVMFCLLYVVCKCSSIIYFKVRDNIMYVNLMVAEKVVVYKRGIRSYFTNWSIRNCVPQSTKPKICSDNYCVVCQDNERSVLLLPCKHAVLCGDCFKRLPVFGRTCPICRERVAKSMDIFL